MPPRYKPYRPGLGIDAAQRCDKVDTFVVALVGAIKRSWQCLLTCGRIYGCGGVEGVLMADGRVPFTSMGIARDYVSHRQVEESNTTVIV